LLVKIITRILCLLTRQGHLVEERGITYMADIGSSKPLTALQAASCGSEDRGRRSEDRNSESSEDEARRLPQLNGAYWDGTTHIVLSPLEFMQRLAARVPRPR
jgi:hypothetical protein